MPPSLVDQFSFAAPVVMIEHVHVEPALRADQGGEKTDRAGAGDQKPLRREAARARADALGLIPGLGDDAGRLDQDAVHAERRIELDQKVRLDAEKIRAVAVALLDAALGVAAVAAHVPFADGAARARHRIGPAHDADDEIAGFEAAIGRRFLHLAERLVADDQTLLARRRPAIGAGDDLAVGAADAERQRAHQHRAVRRRRGGDIFDFCRIGGAGRNGEGAHCLVRDDNVSRNKVRSAPPYAPLGSTRA